MMGIFVLIVSPVSPAGTLTRAQAATPAVPGSYHALAPQRILDTRAGIGAPKAPVPAGGTLSVAVSGRGGLPQTGVSAIAMTVTVTQPARAGYVTVFATGQARPAVSNVNFAAGATVSNLTTATIGAGGKVNIYNGSGGTVQLIADVARYYTAGSASQPNTFTSVTPQRIYDTRDAHPPTGRPILQQIAPRATLTLSMTDYGGIPGSGVGAVVINVTVTDATADGYVLVYPGSENRPPTSSVNFAAGQTVANLVTAKLSEAYPLATGGMMAGGYLNFYNGSNSSWIDLIVDVQGYYLQGSEALPNTFVSLVPGRVLDTRVGNGATRQAVAPGGTVTVQIAGRAGVQSALVTAAVLNLTATQAAHPGSLTVFAANQVRPHASSLNFSAGQTIAALMPSAVDPSGRVDIYNGSSGTVEVIADVVGYFVSGPPMTWTPTALPLPPGGGTYSRVTSVACIAVASCVAVGNFLNGTGEGLILTLSGVAWTAAEAPLPLPTTSSNAGAELSATACTPSGTCIAVGSYSTTGALPRGLIENLANGTWTAVAAPLPSTAASNPSTILNSVACFDAQTCIAAGSYSDSSLAAPRTILYTLRNGSWTGTLEPLPADAGANPVDATGVPACDAPGSCRAASTYIGSSGEHEVAFESLANGTWTAVRGPLPPDSQLGGYPYVAELACNQPGSCTAAGRYTGTGGVTEGLIETLTGGSWHASQAPIPHNVNSFYQATLSGVACPPGGPCLPAGTFAPAGESPPYDSVGLVEEAAGGWQGTMAPLPGTDTFEPEVMALPIACGATGSCSAVGGYWNGTAHVGFLDSYFGGRWTTAPAPLPLDAASGHDYGVSVVACPQSNYCVAVGEYFSTSNSRSGLAEIGTVG